MFSICHMGIQHRWSLYLSIAAFHSVKSLFIICRFAAVFMWKINSSSFLLRYPRYQASEQGRNHVFKVGGPIPWSMYLYRTKCRWYTQFRGLQSVT